MNIRLLMVLVSYVVAAVLISTVRRRSETTLEKAGVCRMNTPQPIKISPRFIFVAGIVLISILIIRDLGTAMNAVICAVALLGIEMGCRTEIYTKAAGIYERGIIAEGRFISYDEIAAIPSLQWDDRTASETVEIVTEQRGSIVIVFSSAEECTAAMDLLVELVPRLGKN